MLNLLKTYKILSIFAFLAFTLISMPYQEANAGAVVAFQADGSTTTTFNSIQACFDVADITLPNAALTVVTNWSIGGVALTAGTVTFVNGACGTNNNDGVTITGMSETFNTAATPAVELADIILQHGGANTQVAAFNIVLTDGAPPTFVSATTISSTQITVTYSEAVVTAGLELGDYTFGGIASNPTTTAVSGGGTTTLTLTLSGTISPSDAPTVTGTFAADDLEDAAAAGNDVATHGPEAVANSLLFSGQGSGCRSDCEAPTLGVNSEGDRLVTNGFTYNGKSTNVESFYTPYPLITANVGQQNKAVFKIYDNYGPQNVAHFSLAFGLGDDQIISESKAMIELDIDFDGTETVTITDPENALDNVRVRTSTGNCNDGDSAIECLIVTIDHTFRAPLDFNIVSTDVWDYRLNSWQNYYNHGIEVVGESLNPPNEYFGIYEGNLIHLIETAKNTAIDADGNLWTFDNIWIKDYIYKGKIDDPITSQGYDRDHVKFNTLKQGQELVASSLFEKYYKTSVSQEPAFEEINDIYPTFVSQGFDRDHPDFAAYQQEQVQIALSFLKQHFPEYASEPFQEINNIYSYEYSEQNEQDSVIKKHNINEEVKKAQQTIQEYYKSSY